MGYIPRVAKSRTQLSDFTFTSNEKIHRKTVSATSFARTAWCNVQMMVSEIPQGQGRWACFLVELTGKEGLSCWFTVS